MNKFESAALRHVNKVLHAEGGELQDQLKPGRRENACDCPITNTIKAGLPTEIKVATDTRTSDLWEHGDKDHLGYPRTVNLRTYKLSKTAGHFVAIFDSPSLLASVLPEPDLTHLVRQDAA